MKTIILTMAGGCVQDVQGLPRDHRLEIHDYDIEKVDWRGLPEGRAGQDKNGDYFERLTWPEVEA